MFDDYDSEEEDSEFDDDYELRRGIRMTDISMTEKQAHAVMADILGGELSMTEGLPELFYDTRKNQLLVEDGNHRIFQQWLDGKNTFDAYVKEGDYHSWLAPIYEGETVFDWDDDYRE